MSAIFLFCFVFLKYSQRDLEFFKLQKQIPQMLIIPCGKFFSSTHHILEGARALQRPSFDTSETWLSLSINTRCWSCQQMPTATDFLHIKIWTLVSSPQVPSERTLFSTLEGVPHYKAPSEFSASKTHWILRCAVAFWKTEGLYLGPTLKEKEQKNSPSIKKVCQLGHEKRHCVYFAHLRVQHARLVLHATGRFVNVFKLANDRCVGSEKSRAENPGMSCNFNCTWIKMIE